MEASILLWIQENLRYDWLNPIVKGITYLGDAGIFWIVLSLILLCIPKQRKLGLTCGLSLIFDLLSVNLFIKKAVARTRPYIAIDELERIIEAQSDYSFPSGHTAASFAVATVLLMRAPKKLSIPMFVMACLISLSRLYVGVHYPTDIIGGAIVGTLCGVLAVYVVDFIWKKVSKK